MGLADDTPAEDIPYILPDDNSPIHNPEAVPAKTVPEGWTWLDKGNAGGLAESGTRVRRWDFDETNKWDPESSSSAHREHHLYSFLVRPDDIRAVKPDDSISVSTTTDKETPTPYPGSPDMATPSSATAPRMSVPPALTDAPVDATSKVQVEHSGTKIILPSMPTNMSMGDAIEHLKRLKTHGEKVVGINEIIKVFPFDGAVAFMKAMQQRFGWAEPQPTPGFFGDKPPQTISIDIAPGKTATIFWGRFTIPGVAGYVECSVYRSEDGEIFFKIGGETIQSNLQTITELADLTRLIARDNSIYRGKALYMRVKDDGFVDMDKAPGFIDLSKRGNLILPDLVDASVRANLFTPVMRTQAVRDAGIPVKRGIILAGPPGTGKTLTAMELAHLCQENGWTFILVPKAKSLADVTKFAARYSPAVVFAEDIDQITNGNRDEAFNDLLNTVDGVNTKNAEVILCFTTNHLGSIERTMVRPGRIDAIIEFPPPDHATIERFLRFYGGKLIAADVDLMKSCDALEGAIPAIVREAVERAKLYALSRGADPFAIQLTDKDILVSVATMKNHVEFFKSKRDDVVSPEEAVGRALKTLLTVQGTTTDELRVDTQAIRKAVRA